MREFLTYLFIYFERDKSNNEKDYLLDFFVMGYVPSFLEARTKYVQMYTAISSEIWVKSSEIIRALVHHVLKSQLPYHWILHKYDLFYVS